MAPFRNRVDRLVSPSVLIAVVVTVLRPSEVNLMRLCMLVSRVLVTAMLLVNIRQR